jgi:DNA-binding response OmpR family regulator
MQNAKILIVDDDTDFVFTTKTVLEQNGYAVLSAGNGNQGKAVLAREIRARQCLPGKSPTW